MLRQYLLLIRAPNLFTVPSNILSGYFATTQLGNTEFPQLLSLIFSSVFLYASGIVLNDYFDINIDRKERPRRPLASGQIPKRNAIVIAGLSIVAGNTLAWSVSLNSVIISSCITIVIFTYNYWFKHNSVSNPLVMGFARFLNVLLGGSSGILLLVTNMDLTLLFLGYCLFLYTASISLLSLKEVWLSERFSKKSLIPIIVSFLAVVLTIVSILIAGLYGYFHIAYTFNLLLFSCVMGVSFFRLFSRVRRLARFGSYTQYMGWSLEKGEERIDSIDRIDISQGIQHHIKTMIISIVVLDSIFLSGLVGMFAGLAVLLLVIPPILLGRKLYIT
jgi:4-hydroxybenzoate polyprenyltransferase